MQHYVDLHMHTHASDGTWSPEELIKNIRKAGIKTFAITDHDDLGSIEAMTQLVANEDLNYINGVELSANYQNREYHILTYDFDLTNPLIIARVKKNHQVRLDYHVLVVETLKNEFPVLSVEEFSTYRYDLSRGGWPSLNYLLDKKVVYNMNDFFSLAKRHQLQLIFDDPQTIIEEIKRAGAIAILAHPPAYVEGNLMTEEQLQTFVDFGIQGLECYSPYYKNSADSAYYVDFCRENNLYISGGSDCHGTLLPNRKLKHPAILKEQLELPFVK